MKSCGALFYSLKTGRILLGLRNFNKSHGGEFSLFGGKINYNENNIDGLKREIIEEIGYIPDIIKIIPYDVFINEKCNFEYISFVCIIKNEFIPILNNEHSGYLWVDPYQIPNNLHTGAKKSLRSKILLKSLKNIKNELMSNKNG